MKISQLFLPTLKETPKEAEVISHTLLLRAGYIRRLAAGIYNFLPLGLRAIQNVERIIREEMNRSGAQELLMPAVQPASIWKESGRWEFYGSELLRIKDRKGGDFCLGPTHEEVITDLVRNELRSYRDLPLNLYQIQSKFRDELRPRAGLMRGREFIMKDAYSFDVDEEAAKRTYRVMYETYERIFDRCGLRYRPVEADTGAIGGNLSHEFQVLADSGEDAIVSCPSCGYTANVEKAELAPIQGEAVAGGPQGPLTRVDTPGAHTVSEVATFLKVPESALVKTLLFNADDRVVAALIRGDLDVNEIKLKTAVGCEQLFLAGPATVEELTQAPVGFAGPVGLQGVEIWADESVRGIQGAVIGANARDQHYTGFDLERDTTGVRFADFRLPREGDHCGRCNDGVFEAFRGIEVGQVFYLGTKYSEPMGATFLNEEGEERDVVMGCYGIGVTRILSAAIEQNHDDDGIIWPMNLAPFQAIILPMRVDDEAVMAAAEKAWTELREAGVEVLLDDRDVRPGVKFKDADLIGIPLRITIGPRALAEGQVELKRRGADGDERVAIDTLTETIVAKIKAEYQGVRQ